MKTGLLVGAMLVGGALWVLAQNPVSIQQVGQTPVSGVVPVAEANRPTVQKVVTTNTPFNPVPVTILNLPATPDGSKVQVQARVDPVVDATAATGTPAPARVTVVGGLDPVTGLVRALPVTATAQPVVILPAPGLPLPVCNAVMRYQCQPKGF